LYKFLINKKSFRSPLRRSPFNYLLISMDNISYKENDNSNEHKITHISDLKSFIKK
jgi:hypothetical protein